MSRKPVYFDLTRSKNDPPMITYEYKDIYPLADGFYGSVFHCQNDAGVQIAVKKLKPSVGISGPHSLMNQKAIRERYRNRLRRECNIWKDLRHPNVAPLIGYWMDIDDNIPLSLVMKLYSNGTIRAYSQANSLTKKARLGLLRGAAKGLSYLHSNKIIHHDVKAANVCIDDDGVPVLIDFGVSINCRSQKSNTLSTSNKSEGRPWQSPERALWHVYGGDSDIPKRSTDVWSFGCLILEVISGLDPWIRYRENAYNEISSAMQPERQETPGQPREYAAMPSTLWDVCNQCWNYQESKRPSMDGIRRQLKVIEGKTLGG
ncbi:hypothetical protein FRC03_011437 [Tulasnella sp. 419]|nr:hypothetical protein FRC03_011437 [Tulasnella sp. 419]